ncbi:hypothetical protein [Sessilibacter corallicola]|uniref:Uncharacterized protein n=1 Tax=Sessilibacter corallicola TaxID=2904075 RepID=A0ABQ0A652_9GAMM
MKLKNLTDWMTFFASQERNCTEGNTTIHAYGEGDLSYLVIEVTESQSPRRTNQYIFNSLNKEKSLFEIIEFLNECNFNQDSVVEKISSANYIADKMNEITKFDQIEIVRYQIRET